MQPDPGPESVKDFNSPADFKSRSGLGFMHMNVLSLLTKMAFLGVWVHSTDADDCIIRNTTKQKHDYFF